MNTRFTTPPTLLIDAKKRGSTISSIRGLLIRASTTNVTAVHIPSRITVGSPIANTEPNKKCCKSLFEPLRETIRTPRARLNK